MTCNTDEYGVGTTTKDPMKVSIDGTPFSVLMDRAVKLKSKQVDDEKKVFNSYPKFVQDTIFDAYGDRKEEVINARASDKSIKEKLIQADKFRTEGNECFKNKNYAGAYRCYTIASGVLRFIENKNSNWKNEVGLLIIQIPPSRLLFKN